MTAPLEYWTDRAETAAVALSYALGQLAVDRGSLWEQEAAAITEVMEGEGE